MVVRAGEQPFDFGDWRVDPTRGLLTAKAGLEVRLEPQLVDLLVLFAGSGGRVLGKDEIVQAVWGGRAIGDDTLAAAISRLRRALGETHRRRYIETIPKRGYRCAVLPADTGQAAPTGAAPLLRPRSEAKSLAERGWSALATPLAPNLAQARAYFEAAVRADPAWGPAHRGLAECLIVQHLAGLGPGLLSAAKVAAGAAVGLDPSSAEAWSTFGLAILFADRDFQAADEALRRAVALDIGLAVAHRHRATAFGSVGRFVEAEREGRKAIELDPYALELRGALLQTLLSARRYGHAAAEANAMLALSPQSSDAWYQRGWALALGGNEAEGLDALLKGLALWGADAERIAALRGVHLRRLRCGLPGGRRPVRGAGAHAAQAAHGCGDAESSGRAGGLGLRSAGRSRRARRHHPHLPAVAAALRPHKGRPAPCAAGAAPASRPLAFPKLSPSRRQTLRRGRMRCLSHRTGGISMRKLLGAAGA